MKHDVGKWKSCTFSYHRTFNLHPCQFGCCCQGKLACLLRVLRLLLMAKARLEVRTTSFFQRFLDWYHDWSCLLGSDNDEVLLPELDGVTNLTTLEKTGAFFDCDQSLNSIDLEGSAESIVRTPRRWYRSSISFFLWCCHWKPWRRTVHLYHLCLGVTFHPVAWLSKGNLTMRGQPQLGPKEEDGTCCHLFGSSRCHFGVFWSLRAVSCWFCIRAIYTVV